MTRKKVIPKEPVNSKFKTVTVVNCLKLNVRSEPKKDSDIVFLVKASHHMVVEDFNDEWVLIHSADGIERHGYAMRQYLQELKP